MRDDDVLAIGELSRECIPSFTPHHNGVTRGGFLEETEVVLEVEKELAVIADGVILVESGDNYEHAKGLRPELCVKNGDFGRFFTVNGTIFDIFTP